MNQYKILESFKGPFPADYEARVEGMLSTVNTELKSATLIYLENGIKSSSDLQKEHEKYFGKLYFDKLAGDWIPYEAPSNNTFEELCHHTFVPIGCVAEEKVKRVAGKKVSTMWSLTDAGEKYGVPLAKFSLKAATEFGSLYPILGSTNTTGNVRAPYVRAKILEELDKKDVMREVDFNSRSSSICYHLEALRDVGFIKYESVNTEKTGWSIKKWKKGKSSDITTKYGGHSLDVVKSVATEIHKQNCDAHKIRENLGNKYCLGTIRCISHALEKDGFVEPVKFKGRKKQSEAKITELGREFIYNYLKPVKRFLADKEVPEIDNIVNNFDPDWIIRGVRLYEPYSKRKNKSLINYCFDFETICNSLKEKDKDFKGLRAADFAKRVGMKKSTANTVINRLYDKNLLTKERKGGTVYYMPKL